MPLPLAVAVLLVPFWTTRFPDDTFTSPLCTTTASHPEITNVFPTTRAWHTALAAVGKQRVAIATLRLSNLIIMVSPHFGRQNRSRAGVFGRAEMALHFTVGVRGSVSHERTAIANWRAARGRAVVALQVDWTIVQERFGVAAILRSRSLTGLIVTVV
ncbi:MAG: hypothetical protein IPK07_11600 [Deltaproteobacteria bacterium]|nr:hypothetical protein [Deltaproteobacteria bacterium]